MSIKSNKFFPNNTNIVKCILFVTDIRDGRTKKVCVHHAISELFEQGRKSYYSHFCSFYKGYL